MVGNKFRAKRDRKSDFIYVLIAYEIWAREGIVGDD